MEDKDLRMLRVRERLCGLVATAVLMSFGLGPAKAALTTIDVSYYRNYPVVAFVHGIPESTYASVFGARIETGTSTGRPGGSIPTDPEFPAFLLEFPNRIAPRAHYSEELLAEAQNSDRGAHWNENGIFSVASLYQAFARGANRSTAAGRLEGAALQVAIWDVLYGDGRRVDNSRSSFSVLASRELVARANAMLSSPANHPDPSLKGTFWRFEPDHSSASCWQDWRDFQDLFGGSLSSIVAVPEPGTYCVAAAAGLYLLMLAGRRIFRAFRPGTEAK